MKKHEYLSLTSVNFQVATAWGQTRLGSSELPKEASDATEALDAFLATLDDAIEDFALPEARELNFAALGDVQDMPDVAPNPSIKALDAPEPVAAFKSTGPEQAQETLARVAAQFETKLPTWTDFPVFELVEHVHTCGCAGCHADREEPSENGDATTGAAQGSLGTHAEMADFLLTGYWNTGYGDGSRSHNVTNSGTDANNGVLHYNLSGYGADADGVTAARATLIREAFKLFESTLGIEFVETTSTDSSVVDFFFRDNASGAYASSGYWNTGAWGSTITSAQINVAASWSGGTSNYNDYTFQTILHEIGHAMGLGHQGPYNGSASYGTDNIYDNDNWQSSMMSYFSQKQATAVNASYEFLQTPMVVDWLALDEIYGRQGYGVSNAYTENTTWGFNTTITSDVSDVWASWSNWAYRTASTIVDGGGIDTLDLSGYANNTVINLAPSDPDATSPSASDIGGRIGNLTIAVGTVIENAIGGEGSETFYGNAADNVLIGNGGNDTFHDSAGSDTYDGGAGEDFALFAKSFGAYTFSIVSGVLQVIDAAIDWVQSSVEWLTFSDQTLSWQAVADGAGTVTNDAPVANADAYSIGEDQILSGGSVLSNDTDPDGDGLTVASVEGVSVGTSGTTVTLASGATVTMFADGTFEYDQNGAFDSLGAGQQATDSFTYRATDGLIQSGDTIVEVAITGVTDNAAPVANADSYSIGEDQVLAGSGLLSNDTDADGEALSVATVEGVSVSSGGTTVTLASGATVTMFADGTFEYDQNGAFDDLDVGQQATDTFTYRATDGTSQSAEATVSIVIAGAFDNSGPVAGNDAYRLEEDGMVWGSVLVNDSDANGDVLSVTALNGSAAKVGVAQTLASGATVTLNADGTFNYDTNGAFADLDDGQTRTDTFTYTISDGQGGTDTASVTMTIDGVSPPQVTKNVMIDFEGLSTGSYGGESGVTFDGLNVTATSKLSGTRAGAAGSDGDFIITTNGEDFDLNSISLVSVSGRQKVVFEAYDDGVLVERLQTSINAKNAKTLSFDSSFDSIDQVVVTGAKDLLVDNISMVTRTAVDPDGNFAPDAVNDMFTTAENATVQGNLLANDSDLNGDTLSLVSIEGAQSGSVTLASGATVTFQTNGDITYDPNGMFDALYDGQSATDSFTYTVSDGKGGVSQATATVTIEGAGVAPIPTSVVVDFETAVQSSGSTVTDGGFLFEDAALIQASRGVTSGANAATSIGNSITVTAMDGEVFDFENGMFTASGRGREDVQITGYLDGVLVASDTFSLRANRETSLSASDPAFDNIDALVVSSSSTITLDDLNFLA